MSSLGSSAAPRGIGLTLNRAKALLQELLSGVSSPRFQKKLATVTSAWGRRELVLNVQREVLPCYGFDGSEYGFEEVAVALHPFLSDSKILELSEAIARKLTLPQSACAAVGEASYAPDFGVRLLGLAEARNCRAVDTQEAEGKHERAAPEPDIAESTADLAAPESSIWRESKRVYAAPVTAILEFLRSFAQLECRTEC
uniref:Protein C10 n=1 Tax=Alexandrium monilatum TaxID=311494 RepID=A0A6T0V9H0_9DINO|mmetsp:Transcript_69953/g.220832  ORF Transcript_69953/g.220832 Transcript_69953/m.220832 type:complete len:199 (+) Transcript_69953:103-699(+)